MTISYETIDTAIGFVTVEVLHSGIRLSTVAQGYYVSKLYIAYPLDEAIDLFVAQLS